MQLFSGDAKGFFRERPLVTSILCAVLVLVTVFCCFFMLEFISGSSAAHLATMPPVYIFLNLATLAVLFSFVLILCNRVWLTCIITTSICGIIAIINYFVLMYHGMPLSFLVLKNFGTAMNVASSYSIFIDWFVLAVLAIMAAVIALSLLFRHITEKRHWSGCKVWLRNAALVVASACVIFFGYFSKNPIKPTQTIGWLWSESYHVYGYTACTIESITQVLRAVNEPEGYSLSVLDEIEITDRSAAETATPDVLLILNETFYDLRQITDLATDVPYLSNIETMENVITGHAVVPVNGGGTNSSEYELLTSNSLQLMPGITPFNVLDLKNANSIVSVLNKQGYSTIGSHSEPGVNYSRIQAYPLLGFDHSYFESAFINQEYYHYRRYESDSCIYDNLIRWYEESPEDSPRFLYNLTIQNHGAWNHNKSDCDIVHALNDYGEHTEEVNEFLTCIYLSDLAFADLTDYFSRQERPVIVCMVGDHCPGFAESIADAQYTGMDKQLRLRTVPLIIWANFPLEDRDLGTMSMNYVVPTLMDIAGMQLTPYYSYMLEVKDSVPIITSIGSYVDTDGNIYAYDSDTGAAYESLMDNYFYLEYNNLSSSRRQELFNP